MNAGQQGPAPGTKAPRPLWILGKTIVGAMAVVTVVVTLQQYHATTLRELLRQEHIARSAVVSRLDARIETAGLGGEIVTLARDLNHKQLYLSELSWLRSIHRLIGHSNRVTNFFFHGFKRWDGKPRDQPEYELLNGESRRTKAGVVAQIEALGVQLQSIRQGELTEEQIRVLVDVIVTSALVSGKIEEATQCLGNLEPPRHYAMLARVELEAALKSQAPR